MIKRMLTSAIIIYTIVIAFVFIIQRSMIYFPTNVIEQVSEETVEFNINNITLRGWVINKGNTNAIIYYGGNAENIEYAISELKSVLNDYTVYFVNYRGYGLSDGSPSEKVIFSDALVIFDSISKTHASISLIGRSLGSGVASYVAANRKPVKVVLVTPYDSILNLAGKQFWFLPVKFLLKDRYESWRYADKISARIMVVAAENDEVIPMKSTTNLVNYLDEENTTLIVLKNTTHNTISMYHDYTKTLDEFL